VSLSACVAFNDFMSPHSWPMDRLSWPTPGRLAVAIGIAIAILAIEGLRVIHAGTPPSHWNLDADWIDDDGWTFPALFTTLLLCSAGVCGFVAGRWRLAGAGLSWYLLGALLFWMGLDEGLAIHERFEDMSGVDWQLLYIPVVAFGAAAWAAVVLRMSSWKRERVWMVLGAVAWFIAQVLEATQWAGDRRVSSYDAQMFTEEILEMCGSALFLLALYSVLVAVRRRRELSA